MSHAIRHLMRSILVVAPFSVIAGLVVSIAAPSATGVVRAANPDVVYVSASDTVATCCVNTFRFGFADLGTDLSSPLEIVNDQNGPVKVLGFEPSAGVAINSGACSPGTIIPKGARCRATLTVAFSDAYETRRQYDWT